MSQLITLFLNNLLPIILSAGSGYVLSRFTKLEARTVSQLVFYIFSPCLIFTLLTRSQLSNQDLVRVGLIALLSMLLVGGLTWLLGKAFRVERRVLSAMMLSSMFMNAGNFGMPVVLFAFGEIALGYASIFFVMNAILAYTLGVVVASMGSTSLGVAITNLIKIPAIYGVVLALLVMRLGWQVPLPIERTINLLGDASIPGMLILLGLQFQGASWKGKEAPLLITTGMRLLAAPFITLLLVPVMGLSHIARQAVILESGTPTAVLTTVLATEYKAEPSFVTAAVFATTLLSPLTITPLLAYLGA